MFSDSPPANDSGTVTGTDTRPLPARRIFDPNTNRLTIVVDVSPTAVDDCRVHAGSNEIQVTLECENDAPVTRTFTPPSVRDAFTDERSAVYNNGVLEIRVGVTRRCDGDSGDLETGSFGSSHEDVRTR